MSESEVSPNPEGPVRPRARARASAVGWTTGDVARGAIVTLAVYWLARLLWFASPLFLTAFLGILFGLAVSSGVDRLERARWPRGISAAAIVIAFFGLLTGFGAFVAPTLHEQGQELRQRLPDAIDRVESWVNSRRDGVLGLVFSGIAGSAKADSATTPAPAPQLPGAKPGAQPPPTVQPETTTVASNLRHRLGEKFAGMARYLFPFLSSTVEVIAGLLIIIFLSIYIAVDPEMYRRGVMHLVAHDRRERFGEVLSAIAAVLRKWLVTQLIAMLTIGAVTTIVLLILRVKAAFVLGLLSGLFEFIPTIGPIMSSLPAIAMGFLDSPEKALWVLLAYVGVQFMENHLLIPLLMKGGIDVPPALTVFSQALLALLFGFLGLMCAVPLLAATTVAVKMLYVEDVVGDKQIGPDENPAEGIKT